MKPGSIRKSLSVVLSLVMLIGSPVMASEAVMIHSSDYLLGEEDVINGQIRNQTGQGVSDLPVQVLHENRVIAVAFSDEDGRFAVQGLRNGQHVLKLGASRLPVRFWSKATAPPATRKGIDIVVDEEVVRSQCTSEFGDYGTVRGQGGLAGQDWQLIGGMLLIGGAVGATLAVTLDDNDSSGAAASLLASP